MKTCLALAVMLIFALVCSAADISGKWMAPVTNPNGAKSERIFTFQVSGEKLTGTITNLQVSIATFEEKGKPAMTGILKTQNADPQEITDGKISGDSVSFAIVSQMFGMEMKTEYKGKIAGDEIKFTVENAGGGMGMGPPQQPQEIVAKRVK
jgi:hypothetical protein